MSLTIQLPANPELSSARARLDIVDGRSTSVQRALRRSGLAAREPSTAAALLAAFDQAGDGFVFFDVGANVGIYSLLCASLFRPSTVVAFEPSPDTARMAEKIAAKNQLEIAVEQVAVGSQPATAELHLSAVSDASNSLAEGFKRTVGSVTVPVTTLDDYVERTGRAPDVIKIDVESLEPEVIKGARHTLESHRPVLVVEILHRRGTDHGPAVTEAMEGLGYVGYRLGANPAWRARRTFKGSPKGKFRDWLLLPAPIDENYISKYRQWRTRLAMCTSDLNEHRMTPTDLWWYSRRRLRRLGKSISARAEPILRAARRRIRTMASRVNRELRARVAEHRNGR